MIDGISDFSQTLETEGNAIKDAILNRAASIISSQAWTDKINQLLNRVIEMLPDEVEIKDTGLWIEGWLYESPIFRFDYMEFLLKTTMQSEE